MTKQNEQLSKQISYILRHAPWEYELELDDEGWVPLEHLLEGLNADGNRVVAREDIEEVIRTSSKTRFEIDGDRIRAFYGHSVPGKLKKQPTEPPEILYHGTVERFLPLIRDTGLKPMSRQYVHLSFEPKTAEIVARRRGKGIVLLKVRARCMERWIEILRGRRSHLAGGFHRRGVDRLRVMNSDSRCRILNSSKGF